MDKILNQEYDKIRFMIIIEGTLGLLYKYRLLAEKWNLVLDSKDVNERKNNIISKCAQVIASFYVHNH